MKFFRKDKQGNFNLGKGFWRLQFGMMGMIILGLILSFGGLIVVGILFGEPDA